MYRGTIHRYTNVIYYFIYCCHKTSGSNRKEGRFYFSPWFQRLWFKVIGSSASGPW